MSIDLGFYDKDDNVSSASKPLPFGHSERDYEDRMKIQRRTNALCVAEHKEWFNCLATIGVGGAYRCASEVRAYTDCKQRLSALLREHYEDLVKTKAITSKELEIEQRVSFARAERDTQQLHTDKLRDAARQELAGKRAAATGNDANVKS